MRDFLDEEKCFRFYKLFPLIFSALLIFLFVVLAIGSLLRGMISFFMPIVVVGCIAVPLTYVVLKIAFAPMILIVDYLEIIAGNTKKEKIVKKEPDSPTAVLLEKVNKKLDAYKDMYDKGLISKDAYENRIAPLLEEKSKLQMQVIEEL